MRLIDRRWIMVGMKTIEKSRALLRTLLILSDAFNLHAEKCEQCGTWRNYLDGGADPQSCPWGEDILKTIRELYTPLMVPESFSSEDRRKYRSIVREVRLSTAKKFGLTPKTIAKYHREDLEWYAAHAHELAMEIRQVGFVGRT